MTQLATITSKRQLTIPAAIFKKVGFSENQKVLVDEEDGEIKIRGAVGYVMSLAGSVKIPKKFKSMDVDEIIEVAKREYFADRFRRKNKR